MTFDVGACNVATISDVMSVHLFVLFISVLLRYLQGSLALKRRKTGGERKPYHKKRKYELVRPPANTKVRDFG